MVWNGGGGFLSQTHEPQPHRGALQTGQFTLFPLILLLVSGKAKKKCACKARTAAPSCKNHPCCKRISPIPCKAQQGEWAELHLTTRLRVERHSPAPFFSENRTFLMPPSVNGEMMQDFMTNVGKLPAESLLGVHQKRLLLCFLALLLIEDFFSFVFKKSLKCVVWCTSKAANVSVLLADF